MVLRGSRAWLCAAVVVAFTIVGCTSSGRATSPAPSNPSPTTEASPTIAPPPVETTRYVRSCGTDVYGDLGARHQWQRSSVVVGPFALVWIRQYTAAGAMNFSQPVAKVMALVKQGHQVALSVPKDERRDVRLIYDLSRGTTFHDGASFVTFKACDYGNASWGSATQFNGGIYVAKPMCLKLLVSTRAEQNKAIFIPFALGRPTCA
jgi:hypothetical protein